jgi:D-galactose 1-dehydrogenase
MKKKRPIKIAIVGVGKIACDQHLPAIWASDEFELVASASLGDTVAGWPGFRSIDDMLAAVPKIEAVALCVPPQYRYMAARAALLAGKHVLMEKPPGATLSEVEDLQALAARQVCTLFASWHSRHAPAVQPAKAFLAEWPPLGVQIIWREDVRVWHPGQEWIWQAGGLGVFDPGINALSILTEILPSRVFLQRATLGFPANRAAPIMAELFFQDADGMQVHADFDWRETTQQRWDIVVQTAAGELRLGDGGASLWRQGVAQVLGEDKEYPSLYRHFAALIRDGRSDVDLSPLRHVADAFMLGLHTQLGLFDH